MVVTGGSARRSNICTGSVHWIVQLEILKLEGASKLIKQKHYNLICIRNIGPPYLVTIIKQKHYNLHNLHT